MVDSMTSRLFQGGLPTAGWRDILGYYRNHGEELERCHKVFIALRTWETDGCWQSLI
jgi:hypothetical protein